MSQCDFCAIPYDDTTRCNQRGKYQLMYSLMNGVPEDEPDFEQYSCAKHITVISFVHNPIHGLPEKILDDKDKERPDLVRKIEKLYEARIKNQPDE